MAERAERRTTSERATRALARRLGRRLRGGERLALSGELGAGKTAFVRGLAEGLGIAPEDVRSPSFPILIPHEGGRVPLYHLDLFRLAPGDLAELGLHEVLDGPGVCAIEWPDRLDEPLGDHLAIAIDFAPGGGRRLVAEAHGARYEPLVEIFAEPRSR